MSKALSLSQPLVTRPAYGQGNAALPKGYVYLITNEVNGKKYVGCTTTSVSRRWVQHKSAARKGRNSYALHSAISKYGVEKFRVETLETIHGDVDELLKAEARLIAQYDSVSPMGYNLTGGGEGAMNLTPEAKSKHALAMAKLPNDPGWRASLARGLKERSASGTWKAAHLEAVRKSAEARRSKTCTKCGIELTQENCPKRSWCRTCTKQYHQDRRAREKAI